MRNVRSSYNRVNNYFNATIYLIQFTLDKLHRTANDKLLCLDL